MKVLVDALAEARLREGRLADFIVTAMPALLARIQGELEEGLRAELEQVKKERDEAITDAEAWASKLWAAEAERDEARRLLAAPEAALGRLRERGETENWSGPLAEDFARIKTERDRLAGVARRVERELNAHGLSDHMSDNECEAGVVLRDLRAALASMEGAKKDTNIPPVQTENPAGHTEVRTTYSSLAEGDK